MTLVLSYPVYFETATHFHLCVVIVYTEKFSLFKEFPATLHWFFRLFFLCIHTANVLLSQNKLLNFLFLIIPYDNNNFKFHNADSHTYNSALLLISYKLPYFLDQDAIKSNNHTYICISLHCSIDKVSKECDPPLLGFLIWYHP